MAINPTPVVTPQQQALKDQIGKLQGQVKTAQDYGYGANETLNQDAQGNILPKSPSATTPIKTLTGYTPEESAISNATKDYITGLGYTINPDGTYTRTDPKPTETGTYQDTLTKYQAQIDALDKAKAEAAARITAEYNQINKGREGAERALLANAGMGGQVSGASEFSNLQTENAKELNANVDASNAKYEVLKSNILSTVQQDANKIYADKLAAYNGNPDKLIQTLQNQTTLKNNSVNRMVSQAISMGWDLTDPSSLDSVKTAATTLGISPDSIISAYKTAKKTADDTALKTKTEQEQAQADIENKKANTAKTNADLNTFSLSEGQARYSIDPKTGKATLIANNPKPVTTTSGDQPILAGSKEFGIAQDLAYGKLTFQQFRSLYSYSRDVNVKTNIYQKASELNPNFNPADFELGYKIASNPKIIQQVSSQDNALARIASMKEISDAAERSNMPMVNKIILPAGFAMGNVKYSNFAIAQKAMADEISGALGFGSATDMTRQLGIDMTNPNMSPAQFNSALDEISNFLVSKRASLVNQMGVYGADRNAMSNQGSNGFSITDPSGATHTFNSQKDLDAFKTAAGL